MLEERIRAGRVRVNGQLAQLGVTVVPVCPLFASHLRDHGDAYVAEGGRFRKPRPADIAFVRRVMRGET